MIICTECGFENEDVEYCENCDYPLKQKNRIPLLIFAILFLLLIYPVLNNIGFYADVKTMKTVKEPQLIKREVAYTIPVEEEVCETRTYRFSTLGGNVDDFSTSVKPNLIIINLEEKWGFFKVNFSFIDEEKYPYDLYGGRDNIAAGEISSKDADFYSENYEFYLGPGERRQINEYVGKPNYTKKYWAIANIIEPDMQVCSKKNTYVNKTENRTFTEYINKRKEVTERRYITLTKYVGINSFFEWLLIIFLLILIIILIIKIRQSQHKN